MLGIPERLLTPEALAKRLVKLGPLFVKLGQYLALRPDLLPQAYCDELLSLVDDAPPVSWAAISKVLEDELEGPADGLFASVRTTPLAAGSLAQVHLAETLDGRRVAVKIQRPDVAGAIDRTLTWVRRIAALLERGGVELPVSSQELAGEIESALREELDFDRELDNQLALADALRDFPTMRVAQPFPELSSKRVLTAEYLEGVPFTELVRLSRLGEAGMIRRRGLNPDTLAERLLLGTYHQMFEAGFFHADPHPGNLIAMPDNIVGIVDCGLCARLGPRLESAQRDFLFALSADNSRGMYRAVARVIQPTGDSDLPGFRRDFVSAADAWSDRRSGDESVERRRSDTSGFMVVAMRLARRHRLRLPASLLALYRTLLTVEAVAQQLGSSADLGSAGRQFFEGSEIEHLFAQLAPARVLKWLADLLSSIETAPLRLQELLEQLNEGQLVLTARTQASEADRRQADRRAKLIALAIVSLAPTVALAAEPHPDLTPWLLVVLAGIYLFMLLLWRRLR